MWRTVNRLLAILSPRFQSWLSVQEARLRTVLIRRGWIEPRVIGFKAEGFRVGSVLANERVPFLRLLRMAVERWKRQ